jgi:anti-anti-sigma factor
VNSDMPPSEPVPTPSAGGDDDRLRLRGEFDLATRDRLHAVLADALDRADGVLEIDVSGVEFLDAGAVHELAWAGREIGRGRVRLVGARDMVLRVLRICGMDSMIDGGTALPRPGEAATGGTTTASEHVGDARDTGIV